MIEGAQFAGLVVIALAIWAIVRRLDVRLVLPLAALALGMLARQLPVVVQAFLITFTNERFVLPICSAMGFAYVLQYTGCDQHLVHLLARPIQRGRLFLIPGTVLIGFLVNIPIISQASTCVTIGAVLIPLLRAAKLSSTTIGAGLLLGASIGGELFNPGAPEIRKVSDTLKVGSMVCVASVAAPLLLHLAVTTGLFWLLSVRAENRLLAANRLRELPEDSPAPADERTTVAFQLNYAKALVPLVPLVFLFLTGPPLQWLTVENVWLIGPGESDDQVSGRLIAVAMLIGTAVAALTAGRAAACIAQAFFEGAGFAFARIISVIIAATCLGKGVEVIGLANWLGSLIEWQPGLLYPCAIGVPLLFACLCGSGFASTGSLFGFFVEPARNLQIDPVAVGAYVSIGAAAGRTMSPVAAVVLLCASLTGAEPLALVRRVAVPLLAGLLAVLVLRAN
jgi:C4-dicarboxylate transporter, DcuC family